MGTHDDTVSPYLRRKPRSYDRFLCEQAERANRAHRTDAPSGPANRDPARGWASARVARGDLPAREARRPARGAVPWTTWTSPQSPPGPFWRRRAGP